VHIRCPRAYTKNDTSIQKCYAWKPLLYMAPQFRVHCTTPSQRAIQVRYAGSTVGLLRAPWGAQSISTNGANSSTQQPRARIVYRWHRLSKRKAKTKRVTSQYLARLGALCGWASVVAGQLSNSARQRISVNGRSSRDCQSATGHAFHW